MVFSSLEMQRRLIWTKLYYKLLYSVWNETSHKPLKVAAAKNLSQVYISFMQLASVNVFCSMWWLVWLFICYKTKLKKKFFFLKKYLCFLQNIHYLQKKMFLYGKKVLYWKIFLLKKTFFTEKNIYENVKNIYLIWEIFFYTENVCITNKI